MSLVADVEVAGVFHKKKTPKLNYELESISHPIFVKRFQFSETSQNHSIARQLSSTSVHPTSPNRVQNSTFHNYQYICSTPPHMQLHDHHRGPIKLLQSPQALWSCFELYSTYEYTPLKINARIEVIIIKER
ncbi:MAG: hypothetical protein EZS28_021513 [Streblomastix strix]|uniref:Uncharacterized protein n=1 Tax=Streblomastix strix TaxID=222440 RepID=A0A5J4VK53_9EUKA|nr:MAG: hypothetical protein EZS28_021513 [Streblomastix strix]